MELIQLTFDLYIQIKRMYIHIEIGVKLSVASNIPIMASQVVKNSYLFILKDLI